MVGDPILSMVEIGWSVFERQADLADYEPRGGVVTAIDDNPDPETGEIRRRYEVLRFPQGRPDFVWLDEHNLNIDATSLPNTAVIRSQIKRINEVLGRSRGTFTSDHVKLQDTAFRLMRAVA